MPTIRYSRHAIERMRERGISATEVGEALEDSRITTPGRTSDRVNRWGRTQQGRRLRVTQPADEPYYVITVVAPDEEAP